MSKLSKAQFVIQGFGDDPSLVTDLVGLKPTAISRCGTWSLSSHTSWLIELPQAVSEDIEAQLAALLRILRPHADGIRLAAARFGAFLSITVDDRDWIWPYDPSAERSGQLVLSPDILALASSIGIGIKLHFFCGLAPPG